MEILQIVIISIFFVCCALLILFIMLQSGKGGGMGMFGGGGGSNTAFGTSSVDVITKATWYGAAGFFILAILAAISFADAGPKIPVADGAGKPAPISTPVDKSKTGEKKEGETKSEKKPDVPGKLPQ